MTTPIYYLGKEEANSWHPTKDRYIGINVGTEEAPVLDWGIVDYSWIGKDGKWVLVFDKNTYTGVSLTNARHFEGAPFKGDMAFFGNGLGEIPGGGAQIFKVFANVATPDGTEVEITDYVTSPPSENNFEGFITQNIVAQSNIGLTDPLLINEDGLVVNSYHDTLGREGYFPSEAGTSEGQFIILRAACLAYQETADPQWLTIIDNCRANLDWLFLKPPPVDTNELYIPHWLFVVKRPVEGQSANLEIPIQITWVSALGKWLGSLPAGGSTFGESVLSLTRLYGPDPDTSRLDFENPYAGVIGVDYGVPENVVTTEFGTSFEIPFANGPSILSSPADARLIAIYDFGSTMPTSVNIEAWPFWRTLEPTEISCAIDTLAWAYETFELLEAVTGETQYTTALAAIAANVYKTYAIDDGRPWFKLFNGNVFEVAGSYIFSARTGFDTNSVVRTPNLDIRVEIPAGTGEAQFGRGVQDEVKVQDTGVLLDFSVEDLTGSVIRIFFQKGSNEATATRYYYDISTANTVFNFDGEKIIPLGDFVPHTLTPDVGWEVAVDPIVAPQPTDVVGFVVETANAVNFNIRRFRPMPEIQLPYTPHIAPFTANAINGTLIDWRGGPGIGYQDPVIWAKLGNTAGLSGMLSFLEDSQTEYSARYSEDGLFVPAYVWERFDSRGVTTASPNTWTFDWVDPNTQWIGYTARCIASCAEAGDIVSISDPANAARAFAIVSPFITLINSVWTDPNRYPPTNIPETVNFVTDGQLIEEGSINTVYNGFVYRANNSGTTGVGRPTFPTSFIGETVVDGSVTFRLAGYAYSTAPMFGEYEEPHAVALMMRAAAYCYKNSIETVASLALLQRGWTYLERIWSASQAYPDMAGTWSGNPAQGEYFGFWSGEIVTILSKLTGELDSVRVAAGISSVDIDARLAEHAVWINTNTRENASETVADMYWISYEGNFGRSNKLPVRLTPKTQRETSLFCDFDDPVAIDDIFMIPQKQWGGDNGGISAENVKMYPNYLSATETGVLRLYGNGSLYTGPVNGVDTLGKETTRKTEVGSAIATRDYLGAGSYRAKVRSSVENGVANGIWTFHFEEIKTSDLRYVDILSYGDTGLAPITDAQGKVTLVRNNEIDLQWPETTQDNARMATWQGVNEFNREVVKVIDGLGVFNDGLFHEVGFDWHINDLTPSINPATGLPRAAKRVDFYVDNVLVYSSENYVPNIAGRLWIGLWYPREEGNTWAGANAAYQQDSMDIDWFSFTPFAETGTLVVGESYPNDIFKSFERFNFNLEVTDTLPLPIQY